MPVRSGDPRKKAAAKKTATKKAVGSRKTATKKAASGMGRARPRPTAVTPVSEWLEEAEGQLQELPSGKVVRIIMPGMQAFLRADIIPNELMPTVLRAIDEQTPMSTPEIQSLQEDPELLVKLADSFDKIFVYCVVDPKFEMPPTQEDVDTWNGKHPDDLVEDPAELRVQGTLYVDRVSMDDKSFVFHVAVGGTRDVQQFRDESAAQLETLSLS